MTNEKIKVLIDSILSSGISAFQKYYKMSGGEWVSETPEYWYTSHIAYGINKKVPEYSICLENSVSEVRTNAVAGKGRPTKRFNSGRADIAVWKHWKTKDEYSAKCIIEIKRGWGWKSKTMGDDIKRLKASILETDNSITDAFFVVVTDAEGKSKKAAEKTIEERVESFKEKTEGHLGENSSIRVEAYRDFSKYYKADESLAAIMVFRLRLDGRKG